jgi:hypothetical protein
MATIMCFHPMTMDKVSFLPCGFCNYNVRLGKITIKRTIEVNEHSLNLHFCIFERSQKKHNSLDYHITMLSFVPTPTRLYSMSFHLQEIVKDMKKHKKKKVKGKF